MEKINAVIFDLDNTLIDRQRAFKEMLMIKLPQILPDSLQSQLDTIVEDIMTWDANGTVSRMNTFTCFINKYQITGISAKQLDEQWAKESGTSVYLFDDVIETLDYLKGKYKLAILSNGNTESQRRKLENIDLYDYMDYTLVSGEFGYHKPDIRIFQYVAQKLNEPAQNCIYIGDNYDADIIGSMNAGMQSIFVNRFNHKDSEVTTIDTLAQLKSIL